MDSFSVEYGNIHFLFGDEDEYYTESLLKLSLKQYLNYCLKRDGYNGIFFVQSDFVEISSADLAEEYCRVEPVHVLWGKKTVYRESIDVLVSGKKIGERHEIRFNKKENPARRIHYMLQNRRGKSKYAFIIPLKSFCDLYESPEMRKELLDILALDHTNFMILLTSSMKADESFPILTENLDVFCSELFPELVRILKSRENLRFYEEMKNELGERYHVLNQLQKGDIRRLLEYIQWVEGKERTGNWKRLGDYTAVLYAWYHVADFGTEENIGLPPKDSRSLAELGRVLRQDNGRCLNSLNSWIDRLYEKHPSVGRLEELFDGVKERTCHPIFAENSDIRRLRSAIGGIANLNRQSLSVRLFEVEQMLRCPWTYQESTEEIGIDRVVKILEEMQRKQLQSETTAVYVLDYLNYTIHNREKEEVHNVFKIKCDCYEQRIKCSSICAELKKSKEEHVRRRNQQHLELEKAKKRLEELRENPLYDELVRQMMEGSVDPSFVALHAPEVNQEKGELVRLDKAIKNETSFINKNQEDISFFTGSINNLEMMLTELCYQKNPISLSNVLQRANEMLKTQGEQEAKTAGELWKITDHIEDTFERLHKPTEAFQDSDDIFAELMGYTRSQKRKLTYEI